MKSLLRILIVLLFSELTFSCAKDETEALPQLKILVKNSNNEIVSGADVFLFNSEADFFTQQNIVNTGNTDSTGACLFTGLEEKEYFFKAQLQEASNLWSTNSVDSLRKGKRLVITTTIY